MESLDNFFLKMQDERVWNTMEYGWLPLVLVDKSRSPTSEFKSKQEWNILDNEGSKANTKALYCIFNGISHNEFHKIIATCKYAKEDWGIVLVTQEDTSIVKSSKLQS